MVDPQRLRALLARLNEKRSRLDAYAVLSAEEYLADEEKVLASKYLLVTAIEDALSVANHVISSEGMRSPTDYADAFRVLAAAGVLKDDLASRLERMARFRNLLVHVYADVDDALVHRFLCTDVEDLTRFAAAVLDAYPSLGD
ncbi:MAG: DUF86 domain-containing protein [Gemmatimonadota bacterium]